MEINKGKKEGSSIRAYYRAYVLKFFSTSKIDYKIDEKIIKEEYEKIKKQIYKDVIAKRNEIIKKEFERYNSFILFIIIKIIKNFDSHPYSFSTPHSTYIKH